jgi:hypothetical protein
MILLQEVDEILGEKNVRSLFATQNHKWFNLTTFGSLRKMRIYYITSENHFPFLQQQTSLFRAR